VIANACQVAGPEFGNVRLEKSLGAGRSKGFWGGKSGKELLAANDPAWREALNDAEYLRRNISTTNQSESKFSVSLLLSFEDAFAAWSKYVSGSGASGHAGFILSTHIAATILSTSSGSCKASSSSTACRTACSWTSTSSSPWPSRCC
jgi:hypothetical protein